MADLESIKGIASIATPLTAAIVETWLKPLLVKIRDADSKSRALIEHGFSNKFQSYLDQAYDRHSFINVLVFQNQRKALESLYIPMRISSLTSKDDRVLLDDFPSRFAEAGSRILIIDSAGMGKSTAMKYLFLCAIRGNMGIPVFIELRKLSRGKSIIEFIIDELTPISGKLEAEFVLQLIADGHFIFLLDGYDEIPIAERDVVTQHLQDFITKASSNSFVMTSRPEQALATFGDFGGFKLEPLIEDEAFALIRKYDEEGVVSSQLIAALSENRLSSVAEFLTNPLLVSLIYKSYDYKPVIPFKKHIFYRQVYDAVFESHDLTKGGAFVREKHSGLDIEDFHRVLRAFGYKTVQLGKVSYSRDEVVGLIESSLELTSGLAPKTSHFLRDLLTTVPLFVQEGHDYRWSHKSIQEYFAACFVSFDAKELQEDILRYLAAGATQYYNVLDLCYDIDYPAFRRWVLVDLAQRFLKHCETTYCQLYPGILVQAIEVRKQVTFDRFFVLGVVPDGWGNHPLLSPEKVRELVTDLPDHLDAIWAGGGIGAYTATDQGLLTLLEVKKNELVADPISSDFEAAITVIGPLLDALGTLVLLDDDPEKLFNNQNYFESVTDAIYDDTYVLLNGAACRRVVEEIEEENGIMRKHRILDGFMRMPR
jgi:hypothetical protein